jgi:predicted AlkP superfamily pyrophosphatase or phosphodiesterase
MRRQSLKLVTMPLAVALAFLVAVLTLAACGGRRGKRASAPSSPGIPVDLGPRPLLLVISVDGLRRDYLDGLADHKLPNLSRLTHEGAVARSLKSVWPSVTYPAHATMVTGVNPARHGIVNNVVFDPYEKNDGGWFWYASDLRVPALWDVARSFGITDIANVTWPVTIGAHAIKWNLPQFWRSKTAEDDKLLCALSTDRLCEELITSNLQIPGEHRLDRDRGLAAAYLIREKHPRLLFLYYPDLDTIEHEQGPQSKEAWAVLEKVDQSIGEVLAAVPTGTKLTVAIMSDHGFTEVKRDVRPNVLLKNAGFLTTIGEGKDEKIKTYRACTWKAGGVTAVMGGPPTLPRNQALAEEVRAMFEARLAKDPQESGIARIRDGAEVEKLGGFPNALLVLEAADGFTFSERYDEPMTPPSKYKGMHGHDPSRTDMNASLILWGHGIRPHAPLGDVPMIDVAPTLARLLGFTLPFAEGKPLRQALTD